MQKKNGEIKFELYDKKIHFFFLPLSVIRISYTNSDISIRTFFAAVGCEVLHLLQEQCFLETSFRN